MAHRERPPRYLRAFGCHPRDERSRGIPRDVSGAERRLGEVELKPPPQESANARLEHLEVVVGVCVHGREHRPARYGRDHADIVQKAPVAERPEAPKVERDGTRSTSRKRETKIGAPS